MSTAHHILGRDFAAAVLLCEAPKVVGERRAPEWRAFPTQWAKIIRKVDGQTVGLKDCMGAPSEFHNTALWVFDSPDFAPWLNVRTRQGR